MYNLDQLTAFVQSGKTTNLMRSYRQIDATTVEFTNYTDGVAGNPVIRQLQPDGNTYVQRPANGEGAILLLERVQ